MPDRIAWEDVSALLERYGDERWVARRITEWRTSANMSQPEAARRMTELGYPMNQSSVWKIENPDKKAGRRSVSIGEAIGFSRLFNKSLAELLLPPGALQEVEGWNLYVEAIEKLNQIAVMWSEYQQLIGTAQYRIAARPALAAQLEQQRAHLDETRRQYWARKWARVKDRPEHAQSTIDRFIAAQHPTPALVATTDLLAGADLPDDQWFRRRPGVR